MKRILGTICFVIIATPLVAQTFNTRHFKMSYSRQDEKNIREIADSLETNYERIVADLGCHEAVNVQVHFYPDTPSYRNGVRRWNPNLPSWSSGSTLGDSAIHMISPNAPNQNYHEVISNVIHEFAHCVSRHVNRKIVNNPRWFWETVAIYESRQRFKPKTLPYLVNQKPPSPQDLNSFTDTTIYYVGYLIGEYLVETNGKSVLNTLIKNNGNIKQTLNMDDETFTRQWFAFVKRKYGI